MDERPKALERDTAHERLRAFGATLERIGLDDFRQLALSWTAAADRSAARATARQAVDAAGLGHLADEAAAAVFAYMDRLYASGSYHPTWVALNWGLSTGPVQDRVAAAEAVQDAALATVAEGIASDAVLATLRAPFELIADVHPMPRGGDTLPTLHDLRRLGPVWGSVAALLVGCAVLGWFLGAWPGLLVAAVAALVVDAWLRTRRDRAAP